MRFLTHLTLEAFLLQLFNLKHHKILALHAKCLVLVVLACKDAVLEGGEMHCRIPRCSQKVYLLWAFLSSAQQSGRSFCGLGTAGQSTMHFTSASRSSSNSKKFVLQSTDLQVCTWEDHKIMPACIKDHTIVLLSSKLMVSIFWCCIFTAQSDVCTSPILL